MSNQVIIGLASSFFLISISIMYQDIIGVYIALLVWVVIVVLNAVEWFINKSVDGAVSGIITTKDGIIATRNKIKRLNVSPRDYLLFGLILLAIVVYLFANRYEINGNKKIDRWTGQVYVIRDYGEFKVPHR